MTPTLATLTDRIAHVHDRAQAVAVQQVNYWLTARNCVVRGRRGQKNYVLEFLGLEERPGYWD